MSLSRRHFVQIGSLSLLATAALSSAFAQSGSEDDTYSPEKLSIFEGVSKQTFEPYLGEKFAISLKGKSLGRLTLIEVTELTPAKAVKGKQLISFALRFRGSGGQLAQDTYTLSQRGLGDFPLLLVPSAPGSATLTYTAVITLFATPKPS